MKAEFASPPIKLYRINDVDYRREEIENFDDGEWIEITTYGDMLENKRIFIPGVKKDDVDRKCETEITGQ